MLHQLQAVSLPIASTAHHPRTVLYRSPCTFLPYEMTEGALKSYPVSANPQVKPMKPSGLWTPSQNELSDLNQHGMLPYL